MLVFTIKIQTFDAAYATRPHGLQISRHRCTEIHRQPVLSVVSSIRSCPGRRTFPPPTPTPSRTTSQSVTLSFSNTDAPAKRKPLLLLRTLCYYPCKQVPQQTYATAILLASRVGSPSGGLSTYTRPDKAVNLHGVSNLFSLSKSHCPMSTEPVLPAIKPARVHVRLPPRCTLDAVRVGYRVHLRAHTTRQGVILRFLFLRFCASRRRSLLPAGPHAWFLRVCEEVGWSTIL